MAGFFYNLGRMIGPKVRKAKWVVRSLTGTEAEAILAEQAVGRDLAQAFLEQLAVERDRERTQLLKQLECLFLVAFERVNARRVVQALGFELWRTDCFSEGLKRLVELSCARVSGPKQIPGSQSRRVGLKKLFQDFYRGNVVF